MEQQQHKKIKKYPAIHPKASPNEIYIKNSRPYAVYLKHSHKVLNKYSTLVIHGMTAAISKAITLSLQLRRQYPYLIPEIHTDSMPTIIQLPNGTRQIKQRSVIHIFLHKSDKNL